MKTTFRISAKVPTAYQYQSILNFGMPVKKHGNGSFTAHQDFDTEDEAKKYLIERAENYYEYESKELTEALNDIEKCGRLNLDACTASIDEVNIDEYIIAFDGGANGTRYVAENDLDYGVIDSQNAKIFDSEEEAEDYMEIYEVKGWIETI